MAYAVVNLNGMLNTLVTEIGEYKVYKTLKHDKNHGEAVARWRDAREPVRYRFDHSPRLAQSHRREQAG